MVDEFQDTDPVQWDILRTAFHQHRTLVLIGDPKQAIYRFRGADVATYLRARADATTQTLHRNWRADPAVLDGLAPILWGTALGDPRITVRPIEPARSGRRLRGGPAVRVRQVTRAALKAPDDAKTPPVARVRDLVHADVAAQVLRTLRDEQIADGDGLASRPAGRHRRAHPRQRARGRGAARARRGGRPGRHLDAVERLRHPVGARLADPALGARPPGRARLRVRGRADAVRRLDGDRARGGDRRAARPAHRPAAVLVARAGRPRRRLPARGDRRGRAARAARAPARRRAAAHRRPARRRGAARRGHAGRPRRGRAARVAAGPRRRGGQRLHRGTQPPPGDRCRGRAGHHDPREQGAAVPRRARAVPVGPVRAGQPVDDRLRPRRPALPARRRQGQPGVRRGREGRCGRRRRRGSAARVRRPHPRDEPGGRLVGPVEELGPRTADPAAAGRSRRRREARRAGQVHHRREDDGGAAVARRATRSSSSW